MILVDHLLETRSPLELAKLAAATAKENALLRDRVSALEHERFWMKVVERNGLQVLFEQADALMAVFGSYEAIEMGSDHPAFLTFADTINRLKGA